MAGSTRIRGNKLAFKLGTPVADHWADISSCTLVGEDSDDIMTFEDAANGGGQDWHFEITAIQSTATGSFWRMLWEKTGEEVAFTYAPHGNETASAAQPHFIGTAKVGAKPQIGGEASKTGAFTFDYTMEVVGQPVMDTGDLGG